MRPGFVRRGHRSPSSSEHIRHIFRDVDRLLLSAARVSLMRQLRQDLSEWKIHGLSVVSRRRCEKSIWR